MDKKEQFLEMVAMANDPVDSLADECVRLLAENENLAKQVDEANADVDNLRSLLLRIKQELASVECA